MHATIHWHWSALNKHSITWWCSSGGHVYIRLNLLLPHKAWGACWHLTWTLENVSRFYRPWKDSPYSASHLNPLHMWGTLSLWSAWSKQERIVNRSWGGMGCSLYSWDWDQWIEFMRRQNDLFIVEGRTSWVKNWSDPSFGKAV